VFWLTLAAVVGCGASGGALFAFSSFVMKGLARLPAPQGIAAMQAINVTAPMPPFMIPFLGSALLCVGLAVVSVFMLDETAGAFLLIGAALYLVGVIGLTGGYHVPRNNALDAVDPDAADAATVWSRYVAEWTRWNHVRSAAGLGAAACFATALAVG